MELIYLLFSCPQLCVHNCVWHLNCVRQCALTIATQDNPADLWQLRHWLQFLQLRTWIHDNLCYLTIKSDTGQHSQFLRCFQKRKKKNYSSYIRNTSCSSYIYYSVYLRNITGLDSLILAFWFKEWDRKRSWAFKALKEALKRALETFRAAKV